MSGENEGGQQSDQQGQEGAGGEGRESDPAKLQAALNRANAKAAQQANALREANEKAAKWDQHAAAQQSAEERWNAERSSLSDRATAAERKAAQYDAAQEAGLPLRMAQRIVGGTPEEMLADAKALAQELGAAQREGANAAKDQQRQARRTPDSSQGRGNSGAASTGAQNQGGEGMALNGDPIEAALRAAVGLK